MPQIGGKRNAPGAGAFSRAMVISRLEADLRIVHDGAAARTKGRRMGSSRVAIAFVAAALFAFAALLVLPYAREAHLLLNAEDDPVMLVDRALDGRFDQAFAVKEIEAALAGND